MYWHCSHTANKGTDYNDIEHAVMSNDYERRKWPVETATRRGAVIEADMHRWNNDVTAALT